MKKAEFDKKFEEKKDLQIAVEALFSNRKVEEAKSMVHIELLSTKDYSSLLNVTNKEMAEGYSLVFALPSSFLSEEKAKIIRQELINRDLLDTIVLIPSDWIGNVRDDIALLFLNTNNRQKGIVKFIDITYDSGGDIAPNGWCVANLIFYNSFPGYENLRGIIDEDQEYLLGKYFDEFICEVGHYKIEKSNCSLEPARYINRLPFFNGYHLYELWDTVDKKVKNTKGRIIHDYDLKDSTSHYEIDVSLIESSEGYGDYYVLNGRYILVAKTGKLCPTLVDTKGYTIYVPCEEIEAIANDDEELLNDYAISELRKPYVEWQRNKWQSGYVSFLRIPVPDSTDGKSSLELQRESFVHNKYKDVCEYCRHPDLFYLIAMLGEEEIKNDSSVPNKIRNVMENYVLPLLYKNDIKPQKGKDGKEPDPKTNISGYSKALPKGTPEYIKGGFYTISFLAPEGSHDHEGTKIQKAIREGECPYLSTSLVYDLINIIVLCKQFENKTI